MSRGECESPLKSLLLRPTRFGVVEIGTYITPTNMSFQRSTLIPIYRGRFLLANENKIIVTLGMQRCRFLGRVSTSLEAQDSHRIGFKVKPVGTTGWRYILMVPLCNGYREW